MYSNTAEPSSRLVGDYYVRKVYEQARAAA
jgi:hypothetical protein